MRFFTPLVAAGIVAAVVIAGLAGTALGPGAAAAVATALVLWLAFAALFRARGRAAGGAVPAWRPDGERPLGDTPELHDTLSPHDLPMGHPGRPAVERAARADAR